MTSRQIGRFLALSVPLLLWPGIAAADAEHAGFMGGFMHPLGGLDHVLAMVAVGLWSGQLGGRIVWVAPLGFMFFMTAGGIIGFTGVDFPFVEQGILASIIIFGVLVMMATKPPVWLGLTAVAAFALFHGYAHGAEMPEGESGYLYAAGFVLATGLLHLAGIALARVLDGIRLHRVVQGLGGAVVAAGLFLVSQG
jgi:urease accessory protein